MIKFDLKTNRLTGKVKSYDGESWVSVDNDVHTQADATDLEHLQVAVYVMCGGGMLGRFAMSQPADFYIDDRVGKLPYSRKDIYQVIEIMRAICHHLSKDAHNLPEPKLFGCWVW
jgi:hypothetical protein